MNPSTSFTTEPKTRQFHAQPYNEIVKSPKALAVDSILIELRRLDAPFVTPADIARHLDLTANALRYHCRNCRALKSWSGSYRFFNSIVTLPSNERSVAPTEKVPAFSGSQLAEKVLAGQAARDAFFEENALQGQMMLRPSVEVDEQLKAQVIEQSETRLEKLLAEKRFDYAQTAQHFLEMVKANKIDNEGLRFALKF